MSKGGCCSGKQPKPDPKGGKTGGLNMRPDYVEKNKTKIIKEVSNQEAEPIEAKLVLIGDMAVGKSSLAGRLNKGDFVDSQH